MLGRPLHIFIFVYTSLQSQTYSKQKIGSVKEKQEIRNGLILCAEPSLLCVFSFLSMESNKAQPICPSSSSTQAAACRCRCRCFSTAIRAAALSTSKDKTIHPSSSPSQHSGQKYPASQEPSFGAIARI